MTETVGNPDNIKPGTSDEAIRTKSNKGMKAKMTYADIVKNGNDASKMRKTIMNHKSYEKDENTSPSKK